MLSASALTNWNIGFFGMYSLQFFFVPAMVMKMNFEGAPEGNFINFLCRFSGIWGLTYCLALYTVKDKTTLMPVNTFLNVLVFLCGPAMAEFAPEAAGITGVTSMHHVGAVGCAGSVLAHLAYFAAPKKVKA